MSRIGKKPIVVPKGVEVTMVDGRLEVRGPKGALSRSFHEHVHVAIEARDGGKEITITVSDANLKTDKALWGLSRALIANMVQGVVEPFKKALEINGVGFRVSAAGQTLNMELGFSHPVVFTLPRGVAATVEKNIITLTGIDKEVVGETAARIRRLRPVEPYKGKGIKYVDEVVRRKAGKAAKTGAAAG